MEDYDAQRLYDLENLVHNLRAEMAVGQPELMTGSYRPTVSAHSADHSERLEALAADIAELQEQANADKHVGGERRGSKLREGPQESRIVIVLTYLEAFISSIFQTIRIVVMGTVGLLTRTLAVGAVLLLLYALAQPLLYASMYHESGVQTGIEIVELVEESTNTAIQLTNTAMDIVRPFQPVWNFVVYWMRRLTTLQSRVMLIAIEEVRLSSSK